MPHPKHPKCDCCGMALYKTFVKGQNTKKSDGWNWCRNEKCERFLINASTGESAYDLEKHIPREAATEKQHNESPIVNKTREYVKEKLRGNDYLSYTLLLAIVAQEIGYFELGNTIIEKYDLGEAFNIKKRKI